MSKLVEDVKLSSLSRDLEMLEFKVTIVSLTKSCNREYKIKFVSHTNRELYLLSDSVAKESIETYLNKWLS